VDIVLSTALLSHLRLASANGQVRGLFEVPVADLVLGQKNAKIGPPETGVLRVKLLGYFKRKE
jgi:hypothetical protein